MINVKEHGDTHQITLSGDITIYNVAELRDKLLPSISQAKKIEIDLSKVTEMGTAGFQLLVYAKNMANENSKELFLNNHSVAVLEVLETYNMVSSFGDSILLRDE